MKMSKWGLALLLPLLAACSGSGADPVEVCVVPLYEGIAKYASMDSIERRAFIEADSIELSAFINVVNGEEMNEETVGSWASSRAVEVFTPLVDSVFGSSRMTKKYIGRILGEARDAGLDIPRRRYAEVVYGRPESVLFVDSVMLIAMNHYLGSDFAGYSHLPLYMRLVKTPDMLPYDLAEALVATSCPYEEREDATVLSRILYEGALAYARTTLTGDNNPQKALGYTPEQYRWLRDNEENLWESLVAKGLLFDTSQSTASRLVDPAPSVPELMPGAPGRAGRFIGYRMVLSYLDNKNGERNLAYLLSPSFYHNPAILSSISYNP